MLQKCVEKLADKEEQLMKLEKQINPLLDDNDQVNSWCCNHNGAINTKALLCLTYPEKVLK